MANRRAQGWHAHIARPPNYDALCHKSSPFLIPLDTRIAVNRLLFKSVCHRRKCLGMEAEQKGAVRALQPQLGILKMSNEDYVYDEESGEWITGAEAAEKASNVDRVEVRDAVGNILADGDQVTLVKDLEVKGAGQTLKRGTLIKSIRLTGDAQEIDCRYDGIKGLVLRAEFVRKR